MQDDELFDELNGPITEYISADDVTQEDFECGDPWGDFKAEMYYEKLRSKLRYAISKSYKPFVYKDIFKLTGLSQDHYEVAKHFFAEVLDEITREEADAIAELEILREIEIDYMTGDNYLIDDGIDSDFQDDIEQNGGLIIHADSKEGTYIIYYSGQWNDSGYDPDSITLFCDPDDKDKECIVNIREDKVYLRTPTKSFDMPLNLSIKDFVRFHSPIDVVVNKTHLPDLVDAISDKKIKVIFDKELFRNKIERLRNLLVFS